MPSAVRWWTSSLPGSDLPPINSALVVNGTGRRLILEVHSHLDQKTVRAVAFQSTAGLARGVSVHASGGPVTVPVGEAVLGRLLDVVGNRRTTGPPCPRTRRDGRSTRAAASEIPDRATDVFETGIKVIDLLTPMAQGGKAAMFGGAGRGQDRSGDGTDPRHGREIRRHLGLRGHRRAVARRA
jgi:F-type H+-transporting ATPase subunit beta